MSLKPVVTKRFKEFTDYKEPGQAVTQMASLGSLSGDLYQDSKRFIYELLQNADDSVVCGRKIDVVIRISGDILIVAHNGKVFDDRDVRGISGVADGTKKNDSSKTGYKGIGFKAVFGQSDCVYIYSSGEYFRFDASYKHPWNDEWEGTQAEWEVANERKFQFPWPIIPIYTLPQEIDPSINQFIGHGQWAVATIIKLKKPADIATAVEELAIKVDMYLFLKNIKKITFLNQTETTIEINEGSDHVVAIKVNGTSKAYWLKKSIELLVPNGITKQLATESDVPDKIKAATKAEIVFAAKIVEGELFHVPINERRLYAYLPTEEKDYDLPVLVNAAFYMVANRESLHKQSIWNQWLFENIPSELLKWIAELVVGPYRRQVYQLLPKKLNNGNELTNAFNNALEFAKNSISFILNSQGNLLKVQEALIDFTFLSGRPFIGPEAIRDFKIKVDGLTNLSVAPFAVNLENRRLRNFGVSSFEWVQLPKLLSTTDFAASHSVADNQLLISHLKELSENEKVSEINNSALSQWPFLLDFRNQLKCPKDVFFPAAGEAPDLASPLSFIHPDLETWATENFEIKFWLEALGVVEKSDATFLEKTIIPNAATFITPENAIKTIKDIFNLFEKGEIGKDVLPQLSELKLLTTKGSLISASKCFLSDEYHPRLELKGHLEEDFFVSSEYITGTSKISEWRSFFTSIGAKEGVSIENFSKRLTVSQLTTFGFQQGYFDQFKDFRTFFNKFTPYEYRNLQSLFLLTHTSTIEIAKIFWTDVIKNFDAGDLQIPAIAYWGQSSRAGAITGDEVSNYLKWYVTNISCLPCSDGLCYDARQIFLNTEENKKIAGEYLPVFVGPDLNADWRSFFSFRQSLALSDYLILLTRIAESPGSSKSTQQQALEYLLDNYTNYSQDELDRISAWGINGMLADTSGVYRFTSELNFYGDGDPSIFGDTYYFAYFTSGIQRHPAFENLLQLLKVTILKQSSFRITAENCVPSTTLLAKLNQIIPYWAKWRENEKISRYDEMLAELEMYFQKLKIFQADQLTITYGELWKKKTNVYYANDELYVLTDWQSPKVIMPLSERLTDAFRAKGYQAQLTFLLTSTLEQVVEYFNDEGIGLPPGNAIAQSATPNISNDEDLDEDDFDLIPQEHKDYQARWQENLANNQDLIKSSHNDPKVMLLNGLKANCPYEKIYLFHFTHLENAVSIIRDSAIKSRRSASFKDSAGSGIISQTDESRKSFARFYFRGKTPTQYYVENLGRAENSMTKIGSDPICPVPIFFIIPLEQLMNKIDWSVSLGSLASPNVEYGNDFDIISKFDFTGVYKNIPDVTVERFRIAAHQEFLVKDKLELNNIEYYIGVQDDQAKRSMLALLGDKDAWEKKILITPGLYHNRNPKIVIADTNNNLEASLTKPHGGRFFLQHSSSNSDLAISANDTHQWITPKWITTSANQKISIESSDSGIKYKLFYHYKGHLWLTYTNSDEYRLDFSWIYNELGSWLVLPTDVDKLMSILKQHPELNYWFAQPIGGPDGLTLEQHTIAVMENYQQYFPAKQNLFTSEQEYLLCLALHDIGKPVAIGLGDKNLQHKETLRILDAIAEMLPVASNTLAKMKSLINGDPIGAFMNPATSNDVSTTSALLKGMAAGFDMDVLQFLQEITIYYQCDAGGYPSLKSKLFASDGDTNKLEFSKDGKRLKFRDSFESKFVKLESYVEFL